MRVLLIVDIQKEFNSNEKYNYIINKIPELKKQYDLTYATLFVQNIEENNLYNEKLSWHKCIDINDTSFDFDISDIKVIKKYGYGIKNIEQYFDKTDEIYIIGCYTEACIMSICFQLWDLGYNFTLLSDYTYSGPNIENETILNQMKINFGICIN